MPRPIHRGRGERPACRDRRARRIFSAKMRARPRRLGLSRKTSSASSRGTAGGLDHRGGIVEAGERLGHRVERVENGLVAERSLAARHHRVAPRSNQARDLGPRYSVRPLRLRHRHERGREQRPIGGGRTRWNALAQARSAMPRSSGSSAAPSAIRASRLATVMPRSPSPSCAVGRVQSGRGGPAIGRAAARAASGVERQPVDRLTDRPEGAVARRLEQPLELAVEVAERDRPPVISIEVA